MNKIGIYTQCKSQKDGCFYDQILKLYDKLRKVSSLGVPFVHTTQEIFFMVVTFGK